MGELVSFPQGPQSIAFLSFSQTLKKKDKRKKKKKKKKKLGT